MTMQIGDHSVLKSDGDKPKETALEASRREAASARRLGSGAVVFQLLRGKTRTHMIKSRCIATENGQQVSLRYIRGMSEIIEEKQGNVAKSGRAIVLRGGKIVASDSALKEFLRRHPDNRANGGASFYEFDPVRQAEDKLKLEDARDKARFMAGQGLENKEAYRIAKLLRLPNIEILDDSEIRVFLRDFASRDPDTFNELAASPEPEMNDILMEALSKNQITFSKNNQSLDFVGGGIILDLPKLKKDAQIEFIIRWGLTEKLGEEFFNTIRKD